MCAQKNRQSEVEAIITRPLDILTNPIKDILEATEKMNHFINKENNLFNIITV